MSTGSKIIDFYENTFDENKRHDDLFGKIQETRTKEILDRFLTGHKLRILDIGGATGIYSFYLAEKGHEITLLDIVPKHIESAQKKAQEKNLQNIQFVVADILEWNPRGISFDAVISHGPMYHLLEEKDRVESMRKIAGVLSPNGVSFTFGINKYAGFFYGMISGRIKEEKYFQSIKSELTTGIRNLGPGWFFHTPDLLENEVQLAGLEVKQSLGVVGPSWMYPQGDEAWSQEEGRAKILEIARLVENDPGIGPDICCIAGPPLAK